MATVELTFSALPAHVRTARLIASAVARRTGVPEVLLDEVRLAIGEACSRAVEAHQRHCPGLPIRIELSDDAGRFEVIVVDAAGELEGESAAPIDLGALRLSDGDDEPMIDSPGFGLAVIAGLADEVKVMPDAEGTRISMSWPVERHPPA